jgi:pimeloyl-ACP methyl ester carboxylesterase
LSAAERSGFERRDVKTGKFTIATYARMGNLEAPLKVYIEGDGLAWIRRNRLSPDPTPREPLALELAALDDSPNVVYLARPCQFVDDPECDPAYWSGKRFSEEVVASMDGAVSRFASKTSGKIRLVGYSGGGAVAVLIAARRNDVESLVTIAGNLNPALVNSIHRVTPLEGSLDPMAVAASLARLPQTHYAGREDAVVPISVARSFKEAAGDAPGIRIVPVSATHHQGWPAVWRDALDAGTN